MTDAQPQINPWLIAIAVMLGTFMEVLDTTITNVALPHVAGSLSAGVDESTWVLSSYLVSNAIVLPASGWLALRFGRKRFLMTCIVLFTLSSLACGLATSLPMLIFFRVLQGLGGGALQPISLAILLESFPRRQHGMAGAVYGIGVVIAPIIGPTLGGWLTDSYSWRWCFYINLPVGLLALLLIQLLVFDPDYIRNHKVKQIDYVGLALLAIGLGALQIVLDKGQREDWFESAWLTRMAVASAVALVLLVIWELRVRDPVINLRALRDRNLAIGTLMMFGFGFALYGSTVLYPIVLQTLLNYTALLSGLALSPGGIATLICMPICGRLISHVDPRRLILCGFITCATALYLMSGFSLQMAFSNAAWPRVLFGVGLAFTFVPLTTVAFATISRETMGNATGIFNLMRNIGGSAGIAAVTTLLARRAQFHQSVLGAHLSAYNPHVYSVVQQTDQFLQWRGPSAPVVTPPTATAMLYGELQRQSTMLAAVDSFWVLATMMTLMIAGLFFLRRPQHHEPLAAAH
jgi:MFS transporter, DHA2 family, multidrug resistance protein